MEQVKSAGIRTFSPLLPVACQRLWAYVGWDSERSRDRLPNDFSPRLDQLSGLVSEGHDRGLVGGLYRAVLCGLPRQVARHLGSDHLTTWGHRVELLALPGGAGHIGAFGCDRIRMFGAD